jgi:hypothetical protein
MISDRCSDEPNPDLLRKTNPAERLNNRTGRWPLPPSCVEKRSGFEPIEITTGDPAATTMLVRGMNRASSMCHGIADDRHYVA